MQRLVKLDATGLLPSTCKRFLSLGFNRLVSLAFIATTLAIGYGGNADLSIFSIDVRGY
jgi:hypothetical protein